MHFKKSELYKSSSANLACFSHSFILMFRGIKGGEKIKVGFSPPPQKMLLALQFQSFILKIFKFSLIFGHLVKMA